MLGSALVCAADEMTDATFRRLDGCGYFPEGTVASALSAALVLSSRPEGALCELAEVRLFHGATHLPQCARELGQSDYEALYGKCPVSAAAGVWMAVKELAAGAQGPILVQKTPAPDGAAIILG